MSPAGVRQTGEPFSRGGELLGQSAMVQTIPRQQGPDSPKPECRKACITQALPITLPIAVGPGAVRV